MDLKRRMLAIVVLISTIFLASCSSNSSAGSFDFSSKADSVISALSTFSSSLCNLSEDELTAITRFLIAFLTFIVLNSVVMMVGEKHGHSWLSKSEKGFPSAAGLGISLFVAIVTFIFLPESILSFIGSSYAAIIGWVLVWAPLVGGIYLWIRMKENLGKFHWLLLALVCIGLAVIYGYGAVTFNEIGGIC